MRLDKMTWVQAKEAINEDVLVIFPIGSIEEHGTVGPLGTDAIVPEELVKRVSNKLGEKLKHIILPTLPYGICPYHMSFPGTIDLGYDIFYGAVNNIIKSMMRHNAKRFLIINGHGGNTSAIDRACLNAYYHGGIAAQVDWWTLSWYLDDSFRGGHGDGQECSAVMAIDENLVDLEGYKKAEYNHLSPHLKNTHVNNMLFKNAPVKIVRPTDAVSPTGEFGPWDSVSTSKEKGEKMLEGCSQYIADFAHEFIKVSLPDSQRNIVDWE